MPPGTAAAAILPETVPQVSALDPAMAEHSSRARQQQVDAVQTRSRQMVTSPAQRHSTSQGGDGASAQVNFPVGACLLCMPKAAWTTPQASVSVVIILSTRIVPALEKT